MVQRILVVDHLSLHFGRAQKDIFKHMVFANKVIFRLSGSIDKIIAAAVGSDTGVHPLHNLMTSFVIKTIRIACG